MMQDINHDLHVILRLRMKIHWFWRSFIYPSRGCKL